MPVYCYKCAQCGVSRTEIRPISRRNNPVPCGVCGAGAMKRDLTAERVNSTDMEYDKPILSDSMGVHPRQVAEHRRLHPGIPISDDGRVIVRSHSEKKRIMKRLGFYDKDAYC
jgi:putative FmdB family regulatory protein